MTAMSNDAPASSDLSPSYDEFYYRHYDGGTYERSGHWPAFFGSLADEIVEYCRQHMARYKVPKRVIFGAVPKTSTGKIQKFMLRQQMKSATAIG